MLTLKPHWDWIAPGKLATIFTAILIITMITNFSPPAVSGNSIKEGDVAPSFSGEDMAGELRSLQNHLGKDVVMLDFWSIYCVSCVQALPNLVALYEKYKDKGFVLYGIDLDTFSARRVQRFIDGLGYEITYPTIIDSKRQIASSYKVGMLPTTIIIGKDGKVKLFHIGYKPGDEEQFSNFINKLIN